MAFSIILQIFLPWAIPSEPPNTVKSWAYTKTCLPSIFPYPVTTPSPRNFLSPIPKSSHLCTTNLSSSTKLFLSRRRSILSLAVSLPISCCFLILASPPPSSASFSLCSSSSIFSFMHMTPNEMLH